MKTHPSTLIFAAMGTAVLLMACNPGPPYPEPIEDVCIGRTTNAPPDAPITDIESVPFEPFKSNVMLLVDRSGSMSLTGSCASPPCQSRWDQLLALGPYLEQVKPSVRLGLSVFPSPATDSCGVDGGILVPVSGAPDIDTQILDALQATSPGGLTPTHTALHHVAEWGRLDDPERNNIVLLLTDGEPNCACSADPVCERTAAVAAVEALTQADPPIKVYVIGFGDSVESQAGQTLTAMAEAAGTARNVPGEPAYYQADSVEELVTRAYEVALDLREPCTYQLCGEPDPATLLVALDGRMLEPCQAGCDDGYLYEPEVGRVTFQGTACAALEDGSAHEVWFGEQ